MPESKTTEEYHALLARKEEELRISGNRINEILNSISDAFITVDGMWRLTFVNAHAERMAIKKSDALIGSLLWDSFPEFASFFFESLAASLKEGKSAADRSYYPEFKRWFDMRCYPTGDGLAIYLLDVSEKVVAETKAREAQDRLMGAMKSLSQGFVLYDADGCIVECNDHFRDCYPLIADLIQPGARLEDLFRAELERSGGSETPERAEETIRQRVHDHLNPTEKPEEKQIAGRWWLISGSRTADGGVVAIHADITEDKRMRERMRDSQKLEAIGQLAGGIAHDFNNLLMIIGGYAKRAADFVGDEKRVSESLREVLKATHTAESLTRQLLAFSRKQTLETKVLDVRDLLPQIETLLRPLLGEQISLEIVIGGGNPIIEADPGQLGQAIVNLAINSRDAMPGGGYLTIGTHNELVRPDAADRRGIPPGNYAVLYASDDGVGMDEETKSKIFEPFFTTKDPGKGTGLGLAMIYGFVQQSNGYITVESEPDAGSIFALYFPLADGTPDEIPEVSEDAPRGRGEMVLVVEDNDALRELTSKIVEDLGYAVLVAHDGLHALEVEDEYEETIDLLLSDVVMPGVNGVEVAKVLRESRPGIKIILMSGYLKDMEEVAATLPDGVPLLAKPVPADRLAQEIREALDA